MTGSNDQRDGISFRQLARGVGMSIVILIAGTIGKDIANSLFPPSRGPPCPLPHGERCGGGTCQSRYRGAFLFSGSDVSSAAVGPRQAR